MSFVGDLFGAGRRGGGAFQPVIEDEEDPSPAPSPSPRARLVADGAPRDLRAATTGRASPSIRARLSFLLDSSGGDSPTPSLRARAASFLRRTSSAPEPDERTALRPRPKRARSVSDRPGPRGSLFDGVRPTLKPRRAMSLRGDFEDDTTAHAHVVHAPAASFHVDADREARRVLNLAAALFGIAALASFVFYWARGWAPLDALYFTVVLLTTVGGRAARNSRVPAAAAPRPVPTE